MKTIYIVLIIIAALAAIWYFTSKSKKPSCSVCGGAVKGKEEFIADCIKKKQDSEPQGIEYIISPETAWRASCEQEWEQKNK